MQRPLRLWIEPTERRTGAGGKIVFVEISSTVYDFTLADETVFQRDNTTLLSPFDVPAVALTVTQEYRVLNESITNALIVNVTSPNPERVDDVEVEFKKSTDTDFSVLGKGDLGRFEILDVEAPLATDTGTITYNIRARAISALGVRGSYTTVIKSWRPIRQGRAHLLLLSAS